MCDPLTIAGAALSLGGVAANSIGQGQAAAASNRAAEAERARQAQLREQAAQVQAHSNSLYQDFGAKQAGRADDLTAYLKGNTIGAQGPAATIEAPTAAAAGSGGNVSITAQGEAAQRGKADDFADQQAGALGTMRSFGDLLGTQNLAQARDAGQIGQIDNFMKGSASVLPLELNAASHAGDTFKTLGGLAQGLGKVGVAAGTSGGIASAFGGGAASGGNVSLPTFANSTAGMSQSAPLSLASAFSRVPSFASSPYRI